MPAAVVDDASEDLLRALRMPRAMADEIATAASAIAVVYRRLASLIRTACPDDLTSLGIPRHVHGLVQCGGEGGAMTLGRFDLIRQRAGFRVIEFNADGPGLVRQALSANARALLVSRERLARSIARSIQRACATVQASGSPRVVVTAEDQPGPIATAHFVRDMLAEHARLRADVVPTESLRLRGDGMLDDKGGPVEVVFRIQALDCLLESLADDSTPPTQIAHRCATLVRGGRLAFVNSPMAYALGSKVLMALMWELAKGSAFFTESERRSVLSYLAPTRLSGMRGPHVVKAALGRRGRAVRVVRSSSNLIRVAPASWAQPVIRQAYLRPSAIWRRTSEGDGKLDVVYSCFIVNGQAAALVARAGHGLTDNGWWVLPIHVR